MPKILHGAILVTVAALLACSNSGPTPAPANTSAPRGNIHARPNAGTHRDAHAESNP